MSTPLTQRQGHLLQNCLRSMDTWKSLINKYMDDEDQELCCSELKKIIKDYCYIEMEAEKTELVCQKLTETLANHANIDIDKYYKKLLDENEPQDYRAHSIWRNFITEDNDVEEVISQASTSQEPVFEELQDSIHFSETFTPPIDPITKNVIQNPYKNISCGHIYEYEFVVQYIKSLKRKAKCPYIGCANTNLGMGQLRQDQATKAAIEAYLEAHPGSVSN